MIETSAENAAMDFRLYDASGRLVLAQKIGAGRAVVSLNGLSAGMYCWQLGTGNGSSSGKILLR